VLRPRLIGKLSQSSNLQAARGGAVDVIARCVCVCVCMCARARASRQAGLLEWLSRRLRAVKIAVAFELGVRCALHINLSVRNSPRVQVKVADCSLDVVGVQTATAGAGVGVRRIQRARVRSPECSGRGWWRCRWCLFVSRLLLGAL
jgi:hypothetical protein